MAAIYLDPASNCTPETLVGALVDLGAKPSALEWELSKLNLPDYHVHFERITLGSRMGVAFSVHAGATHHEHDDGDEHDQHCGEPADAQATEHDHEDDPDSALNLNQLQSEVAAAELSPFVKGCLTAYLAHGATAIPLETLVPNILAAIGLEQLSVNRIMPTAGSDAPRLPEWILQMAPELCLEPAPAPGGARIGTGIGPRENGQADRVLVCHLA